MVELNCKENTMRPRSQCRNSPYTHYRFTVQYTYCSYSNANYVVKRLTVSLAAQTLVSL